MSARMLVPLIAAMTASVPVVSATVYQIAPGDNLQAAVNALAPGDVLLLDGGTYLLSSRSRISISRRGARPTTSAPTVPPAAATPGGS